MVSLFGEYGCWENDHVDLNWVLYDKTQSSQILESLSAPIGGTNNNK